MDGRRPTVASVRGIVAAAHPLAAQAGARILGDGGNAFDAAAATAAALNVVEPYMSGLAGIGAATCYVAAEKRVRTLNFVTRVPAGFPSGAYPAHADIERGPHAAATPGSLAGWCELVRAHGSMSLRQIFQPAITLARDGFPLGQFGADRINSASVTLKPFAFSTEWQRTYAGASGVMVLNEVLRQPDLARTLQVIADEGSAYLYGGRLGEAIVRRLRDLGGHVGMADLREVQPEWADALSAPYRDLVVHTLGPPAEAFQYLLALRILDGFDLGRLERNGANHLDLVWRAIRLAAGERIAHNRPKPDVLSHLLSLAHVDLLRARVADKQPVIGPTEQWVPCMPDSEREFTTSLSVADQAGNMVCLTQSLGLGFGCGVVIPGTGVCLNNALHWGDVDPRGGNTLVPGSALAFPIAPSIATREGRPVLVLGTPGSYGIPQTQVQALVQHVDFGLGIQDAIEEPRARLWDGRKVNVESRVPSETQVELVKRGHDVEEAGPWTLLTGGMQGIAIDLDTGAMTGGADPRREGYVATP